ncbi:plasma membrane protein Pth11-like protein [Podospora appendiculata]|uniref:Plasma membrane protein Pth11-like protein n=1 Tax=Podospora appendiculata TaxID=314037 RepID=A0AAE0X1V1_9PEZI|nr:plasma membrane protein Pth11-like protein [Podospora appendiculata]
MSPTQAYYQTPGHVIAASISLVIIDIISVLLRLSARKRQKQPLKADDWIILPATLLTAGICIDLVFGVSQQALAHPLVIPADFDGNPFELVTPQTTTTFKVQFAYILMLPLALGCVKLSIVLFYFRVFFTSTQSRTYVLLILFNVFVGMWTVAFFLANLFQCRLDFWAFFHSAVDLEAHCPGTSYIDLALCITNFVTDVMVVCVPIPVIWRLNLSRKHKFTATAVFVLGSVAIVASLLRLIMTARMVSGGFDPDDDGILTITEYLYWGMIECGVAILAACLPVFQVLFRNLSWASGFGLLKTISRTEGSRPIILKQTVDVSHHKQGGNGNHGASDFSVSARSIETGESFPAELKSVNYLGGGKFQDVV